MFPSKLIPHLVWLSAGTCSENFYFQRDYIQCKPFQMPFLILRKEFLEYWDWKIYFLFLQNWNTTFHCILSCFKMGFMNWNTFTYYIILFVVLCHYLCIKRTNSWIKICLSRPKFRLASQYLSWILNRIEVDSAQRTVALSMC